MKKTQLYKRLFIFWLAPLISMAPLFGKSKPQEKLAENVKLFKNIKADSKALEIEVHFPKKTSKAVPGIIMFHGGGWKGGDKKQFRFLCQYFASRGLVSATANYTLKQGKARCVQDAIFAIRWFKDNAKKLGVDPNKIITGGGSAGGHVSLLSTTNPDLLPSNSKTDTSVVAYLLFNPALKGKDAKNYNFIEHAPKNFSPAIVFFGDKDKGWLKGWTAAQTKLKSLGNDNVELFMAIGQGHSFFNKPPWKELTVLECDKFLKRLGLVEGEPTLKADTEGKLVKTKTSGKN